MIYTGFPRLALAVRAFEVSGEGGTGVASGSTKLISHWPERTTPLCEDHDVILHRMWIDGTEFNWSTKKAVA